MRLGALLSTDPGRHASLALLLIRVAAGSMLAPHGWYKLADGAQKLAAGLASKGLPLPSLLAWCATLAELVGGLLLVVGLLTRPAAAAVCFTMVTAWATTHLGDAAKIGGPGGPAFEYPFLLSVIAAALAIVGPGRYSLDASLERKVGRG